MITIQITKTVDITPIVKALKRAAVDASRYGGYQTVDNARQLLLAGDVVGCLRKLAGMDTIVRDCIPMIVWDFLDEHKDADPS